MQSFETNRAYSINGPRRGRTAKKPSSASPKQLTYIRNLIAEREIGDFELPLLDQLTGGYSGTASSLIAKLNSMPKKPSASATRTVPPTGSQMKFINDLIREREIGDFELPDLDSLTGGPTGSAAQLIGQLKRLPKLHKDELEDGMYMVSGTVYKVQHAIHGSGRQYAKVLTHSGFQHSAGGLKLIRPEHRMTLEQAKEYGKVYGVCCRCGIALTDEASIEAGIGPVCATKI